MKTESEYIQEFKKRLLELKPIVVVEKEEQGNVSSQKIDDYREKNFAKETV